MSDYENQPGVVPIDTSADRIVTTQSSNPSLDQGEQPDNVLSLDSARFLRAIATPTTLNRLSATRSPEGHMGPDYTFGDQTILYSLLATNAGLARANVALRTENASLHQELRTDHLTKLENHRSLNEIIEACTTSRTPFGLSLFDIENFKMANDKRGFDFGNQILVLFADKLRGTRSYDEAIYLGRSHLDESQQKSSKTGIRTGGDEFALVTIFADTDTSPDIGDQRGTNLQSLACDPAAQIQMVEQTAQRVCTEFAQDPIIIDFNSDDPYGPQLGVRTRSTLYRAGDTLEQMTARADVKAANIANDANCRNKVHPGQISLTFTETSAQ